MNLTTEQKRDINTKVARDMWPDAVIYGDSDVIAVSINHGADNELTFLFSIFDSDNTTDLNKAVEFYGIDVVKIGSSELWVSKKGNFQLKPFADTSRNLAMQQAVTTASGANQKRMSDE